MKLQRIYSSKLYVTSTRKDRIHAAIQDPINAELVQQLSEYLDDEGQMELKQAVKEEETEAADVAPADNSEASGSEDSFAPAPSGGGSHSSFTGDVFKDFGGDDFEGGEEVSEDISVAEGAETAPEVPVEESTKVGGQPITAACQLWNTFDDVVSDCETIKGTLNSREDTTGVNRLQVKDHELWIYYKDDTNLNDKMVEVIETLNALGYTYLTFNRLARSNNAIVFDIELVQGPIKTVKEIEDEVND